MNLWLSSLIILFAGNYSVLPDSLNCYASLRDIHFILHSDCKVLLYFTISECVCLWALNESRDPLLRVALLSLVTAALTAYTLTEAMHHGSAFVIRAHLNTLQWTCTLSTPTLFFSLFFCIIHWGRHMMSVHVNTDHTVHLHGRVTSGWEPFLCLLPFTGLSLCLCHALRAFGGC